MKEMRVRSLLPTLLCLHRGCLMRADSIGAAIAVVRRGHAVTFSQVHAQVS